LSSVIGYGTPENFSVDLFAMTLLNVTLQNQISHMFVQVGTQKDDFLCIRE